MQEIWKPIEDYEGYYEISNCGRVRSIKRMVMSSIRNGGKRIVSERMLTPRIDRGGYLRVTLVKSGCKRKDVFIHKLVAEAFIPNPDNLPIVNHKDENSSNNYDWNLEWCTQGYNINYGTGTQRRSATRKANGNGGRGRRIVQLDLDGKLIQEFVSVRDAARQLGISRDTIKAVLSDKKESYNGYKWVYSLDSNGETQ